MKSAAKAGKDRPKGEDGEDEDDEDAINSDLDDEDEEAEDEEAADGVETRDFVIALYEKVAFGRVAVLASRADQPFRPAGATDQEQVEGDAERWPHLGQRPRIPVCEVCRVRRFSFCVPRRGTLRLVELATDRSTSLACLPGCSEFEW